jgi:hypothetical protein
MAEAAKPAVRIEPAVLPFYEAARAGRLVLAYCPACRRHELPGTRTCPSCLSGDLAWQEASGRGTVFTFVVFRRSLHPAFEVPYAVCVIELDEGPRLVAGLAGVPPEAVEVGMRVEAVFDDAGDEPVPLRFRRSNATPTEEST